MNSTANTMSAAALASIAEACSTRPVELPLASVPDSRDTVRGLRSNEDDQPETYPVTDIGPTGPFAEVLRRRRSDRGFRPSDAAAVGMVIARVGLIRHRWHGSDGYARSSGPVPSAGARHPHVLVLLAQDVRGLLPGPWVFDPDAACLRPANHPAADVDRARTEVAAALRADIPPPAIVFAVARPAATLARYPSGMPLLWRDAGAVLATVHLAAADIGLASCIVGTAGVLHPHHGASDQLLDTGAVALGASA